jgi:putative transposase
VSERRACRALDQHRSSQRYQPQIRADEDALTAAIIALAHRFGRYGYRKITDLLKAAGWAVNAKRVQRIWRAEGLKVPSKQPRRGRLWLADGSCIRLRPTHKNHVWAYDFVMETTHDGRKFRILSVLDEYTRECLAVRVARHITSHDVLYLLSELSLEYGIPDHIRSDNGPEFIARAIRTWLGNLGVTTLFIEPGSPWENGYVESFNGKLRDELLNGEIFYTLKEAQILIERWRREYNHIRPHSSLKGRPPAPETFLVPGFSLKDYAPPTLKQRSALSLS